MGVKGGGGGVPINGSADSMDVSPLGGRREEVNGEGGNLFHNFTLVKREVLHNKLVSSRSNSPNRKGKGYAPRDVRVDGGSIRGRGHLFYPSED